MSEHAKQVPDINGDQFMTPNYPNSFNNTSLFT